MTTSRKSDIRFELQVPISVYRPNFGPIEANLENGSTGNRPLTGPKSNFLSANIWLHGVSKYDEAVVSKYILKKTTPVSSNNSGQLSWFSQKVCRIAPLLYRPVLSTSSHLLKTNRKIKFRYIIMCINFFFTTIFFLTTILTPRFVFLDGPIFENDEILVVLSS
jgi:hypothetical protein